MGDLLSVASLARTLDGALVLPKVDERSSETRPVGDAREEDLRSLVEVVLETLLSNLQDIRDVGHTKEVLHVMETISLRVRVRQLGVDLGFTESLASHLEESYEVVMLASAAGDLDDLEEVGWILGLNV